MGDNPDARAGKIVVNATLGNFAKKGKIGALHKKR